MGNRDAGTNGAIPEGRAARAFSDRAEPGSPDPDPARNGGPAPVRTIRELQELKGSDSGAHVLRREIVNVRVEILDLGILLPEVGGQQIAQGKKADHAIAFHHGYMPDAVGLHTLDHGL